MGLSKPPIHAGLYVLVNDLRQETVVWKGKKQWK